MKNQNSQPFKCSDLLTRYLLLIFYLDKKYYILISFLLIRILSINFFFISFLFKALNLINIDVSIHNSIFFLSRSSKEN